MFGHRKLLHHYIYASSVEYLQTANEFEAGSLKRLEYSAMAKNQLNYLSQVKQLYVEMFDSFRNEGVSDAEVNELKTDFFSQFNSSEFASKMTEAEILHAESKYEECAQIYEDLLNKLGSDPHNYKCTILNDVAHTYFALKDYEKTIDVANKGLSIPYLSNCTEANSKAIFTRKLFTLISKSLFHLERYDEAIVMMEKVIDINRSYDTVYDNLIKIYIAKGDIDNAKNVIQKAIFYETPWKDDTSKKHLDWLAQFT